MSRPAPGRTSLRARTLFIVATTTAALAVGLYLPLRRILLGSFLRLEREAALQDLERAWNGLQSEIDQLHATTRDYATWDDTYAFLAGEPGHRAYAEENFVDTTFQHNRLSLVVLVDRAERIAFAKGLDLGSGRARAPALPAGPLRPLLARDDLLQGMKGVMETPEGPYLVASFPVLPSNRQGPPAGTLVMGRALDATEVSRLGASLRLSLAFAPVARPAGPELVAAAARVSRHEPTLVAPLDEHHLAVYRLVEDVRGAPYLLARVELPRDIYQRGLLGTRSLVLALLLAALVFGTSILLLLERVVLRRVARLSEDVTSVGHAADDSARVTVSGNDELTGLAQAINRMLDELAAARRVIREAFGRYVSEDVARAILSGPQGTTLGGESRTVTILFTDVRDYSTISEKLPASLVVEVLNEYFGALSALVEKEHGVVLGFLGDGMLAVFGAPADLPDHAERAVRCAMDMRATMDGLNRAWDESGKARLWNERGIPSVASRIGLHTGPVVAGNVGSRTRMSYTVIGDAVNIAARVEGLNKSVGTDLLLTDAVYARLPDDLKARCEPKGTHPVKGRQEAVRVWTIAAAGGMA